MRGPFDRRRGVLSPFSNRLNKTGNVLLPASWSDASTGAGTASIAGGVISVNSPGGRDRGFLCQLVPCVPGADLVLTFDATEIVGGNAYPGIGTSNTGRQLGSVHVFEDGPVTFTVEATAAAHWITFTASNGQWEFSNIVVEQTL